MGAAAAKASVGELFEGEVYDQVQKTSPELAYQIFQVSDNIRIMINDLKTFRYINALKSDAHLAVFSLIVKTFQEIGIKWGSDELSKLIDGQLDNPPHNWFDLWRKL